MNHNTHNSTIATTAAATTTIASRTEGSQQQQTAPQAPLPPHNRTLETIAGTTNTMVGTGGAVIVTHSSQRPLVSEQPQWEAAAAAAAVVVNEQFEQEQLIFEKRLCEDAEGLAVKKINQNGKTSLRNVRCLPRDEVVNNMSSRSTRSSSSRSASSWGRHNKNKNNNSQLILKQQRETPLSKDKKNRVLIWGKKKDVQIPLERFLQVRKGKTTARSKRNTAFRSLVLSLITNDPERPSLDIEAPTKLDRDKFARAFARFLEVPLIEEDNSSALTTESRRSSAATDSKASSDKGSAASDRPVTVIGGGDTVRTTRARSSLSDKPAELEQLPPLPPSTLARESSEPKVTGSSHHSQPSSTARDASATNGNSMCGPVVSVVEGGEKKQDIDDTASDVSSITGHGYDPEIVEELHMALNEMRAELEESRAEAARAVKVAEQAIQSAERSNSVEWQNTVTHKAAEAAAMAQKRSAEAMAKQRLAEERLEAERRTAAFWRKQAQLAEEQAGALQTRAASAEVQKAALEEQLESLRRLSIAKQEAVRRDMEKAADGQSEALEAVLEKSRTMNAELNLSRRNAAASSEDIENRNGKQVPAVAAPSKPSTTVTFANADTLSTGGSNVSDLLGKVQAEASLMRHEFELLKQATTADLSRLPQDAHRFMAQVLEALRTTKTESERIRQRLAFEMTSRRKLLNEVQDLRGVVRVYCRPRLLLDVNNAKVLSMPSQDTIVLRRPKKKGTAEMSFEFDRVFDPDSSQQDVFTEIGEVCLGVLDGYNICVMAYGQTGSGKSHTILGDVSYSDAPDYKVTIDNFGVQLLTVKQMFLISKHRSERYKDTFILTILEVFNERLSDLIAGTKAGDTRGAVVLTEKRRKDKKAEDDASSGKNLKLEIRTDNHGETVVQGLISVEVSSFEDVYNIWCEALQNRRRRLDDMDVDAAQYEASSHVIATLKVVSTNVSTGLGTVGAIKFVDLAGSDLIPRQQAAKSSPAKDGLPMPSGGGDSEWKFANRSIETLSEVVSARLDFNRSVPYRNSTLTHVLRDCLEHDSKVILLACVTAGPEKVHETESTLRFATSMSRVNIGTATKHLLSPP